MRHALLVILLASSAWSFAQQPIGIFTKAVDIGQPKSAGSASYLAKDQSYLLKGGGYNIWFNRDEFQFACRRLKGDFMLTANLRLLGAGGNAHRKIGWMIRAGEQDDAAHVSAVVHGDGLTALQWRKMRGAYMRDPEDEIFFPKKAAEIVQLERRGKEYIMRVAIPGEPLQEVGQTSAAELPDEVLAGLFICSHDPAAVEEGLAWNVRIEKTVPDSFNGYRDGILGSRLEIVDVFSGYRSIVYEESGRFEAPNWLPDGKKLLFNREGSIYTLPVMGGQPELLNTGDVKRNNNDHVISFDGKWLGISSHRDGMPGGGSTVYYLPLTGGKPVLVTDSTPSYLHGWNPGGTELIYTAQRISKGPAYNIYKKPINGGPEVALTTNPSGLADGPEYSPDGKWIYFNWNQTGTMQLWRMRPDGSGKEQLTFDEYNNWFAHISPNNKWIAFLSFPNSINPGDHPFYKHVMIRIMPVGGGAPRVVASLFGGQGTINTPSWSPDSQRLAFVSNSGALEP